MIVELDRQVEKSWKREFRSGLEYTRRMRGENPELVEVANEFMATNFEADNCRAKEDMRKLIAKHPHGLGCFTGDIASNKPLDSHLLLGTTLVV